MPTKTAVLWSRYFMGRTQRKSAWQSGSHTKLNPNLGSNLGNRHSPLYTKSNLRLSYLEDGKVRKLPFADKHYLPGFLSSML